MRQLLSGDQRAFTQFVDEYFPKLFRYAMIRLGNEQDVEDVVQNTLGSAARYLHGFRGESTLLTWLIGICRREIGHLYGHRSRKDALEVSYLSDEGLRFIVENLEADTAGDPRHASERMELSSSIQLALDQLPARYADALQWKYFEGCSSQEIAARLAIGDEAVQSLLARARALFRSSFAAAFDS